MNLIKKIVKNTIVMVIKIMPFMAYLYLDNHQKEFLYNTTIGGFLTLLLLFIIIFQIMFNDIK